MKRNPNSHKGQNGKVLVIGGNALFHGAPILCALGAERSGVDLVFPFLPPCHAQVARTYSLNFIVRTFAKDHLTPKDVKPILEAGQQADVVVMGPGLGKEKDTEKAVRMLLAALDRPTIVDADALVFTNSLPRTVVLTPHRGEFTALTGEAPTAENVQKWAKNLNATILCKGPEDIIASNDELIINKTGNALMTVGGTGDVLGGLVAGLMAQGEKPMEACRIATAALGTAADRLAEKQDSLTAQGLVDILPEMLYKMS